MSLSDFEDFEDFEKGLLRSAETDEPTAASRAANRAAVMKAAGLAAGAAASASASANASAAGAAGKTTATAKVAIAAKLAAVPKLAALAAAGVVAAGVVVTAIAVQGSSGGEPVPLEARPSGSALVRPAPATAAMSEGDEAPTAPPPASMPSVMSPPPESVAHAATGGAEAANRDPAVARTPSVPASAGPTEPSRPTLEPLAEETRLLEEARTCMDRGDLACGAAKLGEHRARFAHGMLTEEAAVLRIQVARRRGDVEEARRLANELLHANPNGPYARRARAILDELARAEQPDR
ncbi:MAG: hypothetical protein KF764_12935 [Labilithrix sp.]|nr:hypothetical protein [Labilithrix sp.]